MLENDIIRLRALEPEDLELMYRWENDPLLWKEGNTLVPYSRFVLRRYMELQPEDIYTTKQLRLMIVLKTTGEAIGTLDMFDFDPYHNRASIGILIEQLHQSSGLGTQALALFIQYAFRWLKLNQLYCYVNEDNERSLILFQKQGFEITGKLKAWFNTPEGRKDVYILQLMNNLNYE